MATIPSTSTYTVGEKPTAAKLNANGKTALDFLLATPAFSVSRSATGQAITSGTTTAISFDTEVFDTDNMWTSGTNIVVATAGLWHLSAQAAFPTNATGRRICILAVNGTFVARTDMAAFAGGQSTVPVSTLVRLAVGDVVTLNVLQDSTVSLTTSTQPGGACAIQGRWVGI